MPFREIIDVYSEKLIHYVEKMQMYWFLKQVLHIVTTGL
jgi:hypothetical protein